MLKRFMSFFRAGIMPVQGMVADKSAAFGFVGLMSNMNAYAEGVTSITTAGTNSTLTTAQLLAKNILLASGASGDFTITLPSTASILSALGPTIPADGSFYFPLYFANQNTTHTGTLTAGDASTTVSGTATCATNTSVKFMVQVATATTLVITRVLAGDV